MKNIESSQKIIVNNVIINYIAMGDASKPTVIFIHGFPFNKYMWQAQINLLKDKYHVIAYDVRGHGNSELGTEELSIDLFGEDLIGFMNALKLDKVILCGLSMGGYITLNVLSKHQDRFMGALLCDTTCTADSPEGKEKRKKNIERVKVEGLTNYTEESLKILFAPESLTNHAEIVEKIRNTIVNTPVETITKTLTALGNREETCSKLAQIKIPVTILVGEKDMLTPISTARLLHENILNSTLHLISEAGHLSNLENPNQFNMILDDFLKQFTCS
jgi:pimeloyl-ACP methyl ester carboxylesterase